MYLGGEWVSSKTAIDVTCPYDGTLVGKVAAATRADYTKAIEIADQAFAVTRKLPSYQREQILHQIADGIEKNAEKLAHSISLEMGKVIRDARSEVGRAVSTFRVSAEEAKRIGGDVIDLDWLPGHEQRTGIVRRFPIGVIAGITPFNFPINLVAHKVGPAIASGNTIVLKPASKTPIVALLLAEVIDRAICPKAPSACCRDRRRSRRRCWRTNASNSSRSPARRRSVGTSSSTVARRKSYLNSVAMPV